MWEGTSTMVSTNNEVNDFNLTENYQNSRVGQSASSNSAYPSMGSSKVSSTTNLRSIEAIPEPYKDVFGSYPSFNEIQSRVFNDVYYTDESLVVAAPTGSGKTVIFELAIVKLLMSLEVSHYRKDYKIVYVSPSKALCEERLVDWNKKFSSFDVNCVCATGDSNELDYSYLKNNALIITTPEKWDSLTRKWREYQQMVQVVKLFMIDEIHLLNEENRGPTLEAIVSRMKTIQDCTSSSLRRDSDVPDKIRFVAVSATISNVADIAEWLGDKSKPARYFKFDDSMRPVKLQKVVLGYHYNSSASSPFKFDIMLSYKLSNILLQYANGKPTLIFCSTRKSVEMTSKHLAQNLTITLNPGQKRILVETANGIGLAPLREILVHGVGFHHAGILPENRKVIENLFRNRDLPILVTTSTLAMGVNLPAHLVIIKSTKYYANGEFTDYSESNLFQMIGRAGRPQYDTSATAVIMTTASDKLKYENMVGGTQPVESHLHRHLPEYLNAEVVLRTITDLGVAMQWLTSTFLYVRARKNPIHYGLPQGPTFEQLDKKLLDMCHIEINKLSRAGMLTIDENILIIPTRTGCLMASYYVALETMKLFTQITGKEILQQILGLISKCQEYSEMYLRTNDKKTLNLLNKCRNKETIRFTLNGKIKTLDMKINCIIQAVLGCLEIRETSLVLEAQKIMRIGERLLNCLAEYLETKENCYSALLNTLILAKCCHARIWENSPFVSRQLTGIGVSLSNLLVAAGKNTLESIVESNPRDIERIINRKCPTGDKLREEIRHLPKYTLSVSEEDSNDAEATIEIVVRLENAVDLREKMTVKPESSMNFIIGDDDNNIILHEKYTHSYMMENLEILKRINVNFRADREIFVHFISENWVGIDVQENIILFSTAEPTVSDKKETILRNKVGVTTNKSNTNSNQKPTRRKATGSIKTSVCGNSHIKQFMDMYFKKAITAPRKLSAKISTTNAIKKTSTENIDETENSEKLDSTELISKTETVCNDSVMKLGDILQSLSNGGNRNYMNCANLNVISQNTSNLAESWIPEDQNQREHSIENIDLEKLGDANITQSRYQTEAIVTSLISTPTPFLGVSKNCMSVKRIKNVSQNRDKEREYLRINEIEDLSSTSNSPNVKKSKSGPNLQEFAPLPKRKCPTIAEYSVLKKKNEDKLCSTKYANNQDYQGPHDAKLSSFEDNRSKENDSNINLIEFNRKTITWSSPLVISPVMMYSPNLVNPRCAPVISSKIDSKRSSATHASGFHHSADISSASRSTEGSSQPNDSVKINSKNTSSSLDQSGIDLQTSTDFPLTDKEWSCKREEEQTEDRCEDSISTSTLELASAIKPSESNSDVAKPKELTIFDIVSSSFAEAFGLREKISAENNTSKMRSQDSSENSITSKFLVSRRKVKSAKTKTANISSYYAELMSQNLAKAENVSKSESFDVDNTRLESSQRTRSSALASENIEKTISLNKCDSQMPDISRNRKNLGLKTFALSIEDSDSRDYNSSKFQLRQEDVAPEEMRQFMKSSNEANSSQNYHYNVDNGQNFERRQGNHDLDCMLLDETKCYNYAQNYNEQSQNNIESEKRYTLTNKLKWNVHEDDLIYPTDLILSGVESKKKFGFDDRTDENKNVVIDENKKAQLQRKYSWENEFLDCDFTFENHQRETNNENITPNCSQSTVPYRHNESMIKVDNKQGWSFHEEYAPLQLCSQENYMPARQELHKNAYGRGNVSNNQISNPQIPNYNHSPRISKPIKANLEQCLPSLRNNYVTPNTPSLRYNCSECCTPEQSVFTSSQFNAHLRADIALDPQIPTPKNAALPSAEFQRSQRIFQINHSFTFDEQAPACRNNVLQENGNRNDKILSSLPRENATRNQDQRYQNYHVYKRFSPYQISSAKVKMNDGLPHEILVDRLKASSSYQEQSFAQRMREIMRAKNTRNKSEMLHQNRYFGGDTSESSWHERKRNIELPQNRSFSDVMNFNRSQYPSTAVIPKQACRLGNSLPYQTNSICRNESYRHGADYMRGRNTNLSDGFHRIGRQMPYVYYGQEDQYLSYPENFSYGGQPQNATTHPMHSSNERLLMQQNNTGYTNRNYTSYDLDRLHGFEQYEGKKFGDRFLIDQYLRSCELQPREDEGNARSFNRTASSQDLSGFESVFNN